MAGPVLYGKNIPAAKPSTRRVDLRSLSFGASGPELPYPVYQFSGYRTRYEWPQHNPFKGL